MDALTSAAIMFPLGVRLSTWIALLVFCLLAAWRSERAPLLAAIAWLAGFETAYQAAAMVIRTPQPVPVIGPVSLSLLIGMPTIAVLATLAGARPYLPLFFAALLVFVAWIATGFHVNTPQTRMNVPAEVLNETAKLLWAAAYLVPLLVAVRRRPSRAFARPALREVRGRRSGRNRASSAW